MFYNIIFKAKRLLSIILYPIIVVLIIVFVFSIFISEEEQDLTIVFVVIRITIHFILILYPAISLIEYLHRIFLWKLVDATFDYISEEERTREVSKGNDSDDSYSVTEHYTIYTFEVYYTAKSGKAIIILYSMRSICLNMHKRFIIILL